VEQTAYALASEGISPCSNCYTGWYNDSDDGSEFCQDSCEIYETYLSVNKAREEMKAGVDCLSHEQVFGEHLKEAKEVLDPLFKKFLIRFKEAWTTLGRK